MYESTLFSTIVVLSNDIEDLEAEIQLMASGQGRRIWKRTPRDNYLLDRQITQETRRQD